MVNNTEAGTEVLPKEGATEKKRNGRINKILLCLLIIFIILSVIMSATIGILFFKSTPDVCLSSGCIRTASVILSSMNASANPCEDFYAYACGNWMKNNPIPDDAPSVSNFENLGHDLELALKELLEERVIEGLDGEAVKKAKVFYNLCLNSSQIMSTWRNVFNEVIDGFGGWPALTPEVDVSGIKIEHLYGKMVSQFKADSLFKASVQPDDKNSEKHIILLDQPALNLFARDFYIMDEAEDERQAYMTLITDVLLLLDANNDAVNQSAREILAFETQLANVSDTSYNENVTATEEQRHDIADMYNKITLGEMKRKLPNFDWILFFDTLFEKIPDKNGKKITFDDSTQIVIYGIDFVYKLNDLLPKFDKRTIVNYLNWCWFYKAMVRDLPDPFAFTIFKFYQTLNLMQVPKLRWHGCISRINMLLPMATSSVYIRNHFDHEAKKQVEEMISLIMESFVELLESEDWLSEETKDFAKIKVRSMSQKIGYPDYLNDTKAVDKEYEHYKVFHGDYYRTKFQFYEMYQHDALERIKLPVDRERWVAGAALVNAFYSPNTNEIIFPAGILQPVFYDKHFPSSMNFGGIGVVIGHEITHGFDDRGRLYDSVGNIRQWWDNTTIKRFEEKAQCIEEQYSNYVLDQISMRINGRSTKGENIADNGGLKQAYRAYKRYESKHTPPQRLPGVNLTHDQLFFLNYAQIWCGAMNDKEAIRKLRTSEHSPGPIRVKGPLSNSYDFAKAFNCPPGSLMNPVEKCRVW
uniref:Phosphate-regulating neutral endopeptidase (inferred by orthology to a human protein) n=1 Tax=Strongyloides venezuelensis TaxID=75913 RepID=A0A0K0EV78_STRVS